MFRYAASTPEAGTPCTAPSICSSASAHLDNLKRQLTFFRSMSPRTALNNLPPFSRDLTLLLNLSSWTTSQTFSVNRAASCCLSSLPSACKLTITASQSASKFRRGVPGCVDPVASPREGEGAGRNLPGDRSDALCNLRGDASEESTARDERNCAAAAPRGEAPGGRGGLLGTRAGTRGVWKGLTRPTGVSSSLPEDDPRSSNSCDGLDESSSR
mmetsp:Transcript_49908/g.132635  ORF Transcript_49908/g.132635 Transcript_49908/m.132635 type:complete len:214 (+) Transcript_49908:1745-2386(+)